MPPIQMPCPVNFSRKLYRTLPFLQLVPPKQIPSMKASPLPLNAYTLHNLAHIELNAIDLAWDTVARFSGLGLPDDFYADFARCATSF